MRVCVVGNGPSANGRGAHIDGYDFVVRCNRFKQAFVGDSAGRKLSAFAWAGLKRWNKIVPPGKFEMWITCPEAWHKGKERLTNARAICKKRKLKLRVIDLHRYMEVRRALEALSPKTGKFPPTTGLLAVDMALAAGAKELLIVGFDATTPEEPGWRYGNPKLHYATGPGHDFSAEKQMLDTLCSEQTWCGIKQYCRVRRITL